MTTRAIGTAAGGADYAIRSGGASPHLVATY
jgi:hypothetical protein